MRRSNCILVYGNTTRGDVMKRSDSILVCASTTKGDVFKRPDCILVYGRIPRVMFLRGQTVYWCMGEYQG